MKKIILLCGIAFLSACASTKQSTNNTNVKSNELEVQKAIEEAVKAAQEETKSEPELTKEFPEYQATAERKWDLLHTKLEVGFDFKKRYLNGIATLTLKPYFYASNTLVLDAKGMNINKLSLLQNGVEKKLNFTYDSLQINIKLDKIYTKNEELMLLINYTAKPDELPDPEGSMAITSDKGLYFIDPDNTDPNKPTQIWTQGETESASCWFPTIDKPNERCSEEIYITVPNQYQTLSNGLLISSTPAANNMRTDYWKQDKPHAPYLFMMVVGEFETYKDQWRGKEVNYYVEKEFKPHIKNIFGNTPEMIEFFSTKVTGVEYPWDKFSNVCVRDYVSGAMENTSAVIYLEQLQQTPREQLDNDMESIIAHELFHHWFGDLVTCESWSNLPLNESFANYSEYLWSEYKYGKEMADYENLKETEGYMMEAKSKKANLIRFNYKDKEEMFDQHSYNKGGRILHMLRNYIGDDAFFASFKKYLNDNKFKSAEVHNLRLAFEEVTGKDLNWYFNQWFLGASHPKLDITYSYDEQAHKAICVVKQQQVEKQEQLFRLPVNIDIYTNGKVDRKNVECNSYIDTFAFDVATKPDLINFDADKILLCEKRENKTIAEYAYQYTHATTWKDRFEALNACSKKANSTPEANEVLYKGINDKFFSLRNIAIDAINVDDSLMKTKVEPLLKNLALKDGKSSVRASAIKKLLQLGGADYLDIYNTALKDSSYSVESAALKAINKSNKTEGLAAARSLMNEKSIRIAIPVCEILSDQNTVDNNDFKYFNTWFNKADSYSKFGIIGPYTKYVLKTNDELTVDKATEEITNLHKNSTAFWIKTACQTSLEKFQKYYEEKGMNDKANAINQYLEAKEANIEIKK